MTISETEKPHKNRMKDNFTVTTSSPERITRNGLEKLFPGSVIVGVPQETGIAVLNSSPFGSYVTAAIKSPQHIFDGKKFWGEQTEKMIEYSLVHPIGKEHAIAVAEKLIQSASLPTMGFELEGYTHDAKTGRLVPAQTQIETSRSLREDPTDTISITLEDLAQTRAKMIIGRAKNEAEQGNIVIESGVPLTFGGERPQDSTGLIASDNPYIQAMCRIFENSYFIPAHLLDSRVQQVLNSYAKTFAYKDIQEMLSQLGVARVWDIAASHVSFGIPGNPPSTEIGIAIANIFSSDLATVAEFFTQGTPLHAGQIVSVEENGVNHTIKDVRTFTRKYLRTAYVNEPFIRDTDDLQNRIVHGVVDGIATTPDRAAFHTIGPDGVKSISAHARARYRGFGDPSIPSARVEFVGCSSTPSVYDVVARDAYLAILWTAALEAVSKGASPQEYFSAQGFPSSAEWRGQDELTMKYAIHGTHDDAVRSLVDENITFLQYMKNRYPHLRNHIEFVVSRIENMSKQTVAHTIDEYTKHPQGSISDVIVEMKQSGFDDVEILRQLNQHQLDVSEKILECEGNFITLLNVVVP